MTTSRADFARLASDYLRAQGEARPIHYDEGRNRLVVGDGDWTSFISLEHALTEYEANAVSEKARVLARRFWSSVRRAEPPSEVDVIRSILPRIRDRAWFSAVRRQAELELGADEEAIDEVTLPHRVINDELAAHLAFDLPTSVMEIGPDRLEAFGLKFDELFNRAVENLRERPQVDFEQPDSTVAAFVSPYRDGFDATRMLLTERFTSLPVKGRPVVLAPTHDIVLVAGDEDESALEAIATWGEQALLEPKPHTAHAFRYEDERWRPWLPVRMHRAWQKLKVLQLQSFASAYARQKEVLEALLQANGHTILVGTLRAFRTPGGDIFTSTAWNSGVEALLPQTDRIDFVRTNPDGSTSGAKTWSTTFEVARKVVPHLMEATGDTPERWRVIGFPLDSELEQMASLGKLPE
ncbi:MAG: hypothetical protein JNM69_02620 [Archangium sp.]|nr:hypothetical protein [Archangium sp.]